MKAAFTPGPWAVDAYGERITVRAEDAQFIADCADGHYNDEGDWIECPDSMPNARLIAAAPDLLQALQMLYAETADYIQLNKLGGMDNQCMKLARAALSKAAGSGE